MSTQLCYLYLYDITGPDWNAITPEIIDHLYTTMQQLPLLGEKPNQYSITGVTRVNDVIGGFAATQYEREVLEYDSNKQEQKSNRPEWEKTAFALFPQIGKVLFQSRNYPQGLTKERVYNLFRSTLQEVIRGSGLGYDVLITPLEPQEVSDEEFIRTFDDSDNRIDRLKVRELRSNDLLTGLTYYNPQRERNEIIGQGLSDDFKRIESLEINAEPKQENLQQSFIAKAAVRSGRNERMSVYSTKTGQKYTILRIRQTDFRIEIDVDADPIRAEDVDKMAEQVLSQYGHYEPPRKPVGHHVQQSFLEDQ